MLLRAHRQRDDRPRKFGAAFGAVALERVDAELETREIAELELGMQLLPRAEDGFPRSIWREELDVVSEEDRVERE